MEVIEIMGEQQEIVNTLNRLVPREGRGNFSHLKLPGLVPNCGIFTDGFDLWKRSLVLSCNCMLQVSRANAEKKEREEKATHPCYCTTRF